MAPGETPASFLANALQRESQAAPGSPQRHRAGRPCAVQPATGRQRSGCAGSGSGGDASQYEAIVLGASGAAGQQQPRRPQRPAQCREIREQRLPAAGVGGLPYPARPARQR